MRGGGRRFSRSRFYRTRPGVPDDKRPWRVTEGESVWSRLRWCVCVRERDCKEKLVRARRSPRVRLHRCFNLIHPVEEWESTVDTTERYTLRPAMAVDGKSADWNNPTSRTHFPCHSSVQHSHTRFIPHTRMHAWRGYGSPKDAQLQQIYYETFMKLSSEMFIHCHFNIL